jgi:hypothetical protein
MVEYQSQEVSLEDELLANEYDVDKGLAVVTDAEVEVEKGLSAVQELVAVETWM